MWRFLLANLFYPGLLRANVMLPHKMFYETDFQKLVVLVVRQAERAVCRMEAARNPKQVLVRTEGGGYTPIGERGTL